MAKRRPRPRMSAEEKKMRQLRSCGVVTLVGVLTLVALYVGLRFFHGDHEHESSPHGGVIVSVEDGQGHHHVEAVVEKGSTLKLYTFGEEVDRPLAVESQVLTAQLKREADGEFTSVDLMPVPQVSDPEDRTSQFFGKLPQGLRGSPLAVRIANFEIGGKRFPLEFTVPASPQGGEADHTQDEEKLYVTAGGKYTRADIAANGKETASAKYKGFRADHNLKPTRGDRVCPITRIKTDRDTTWVVSSNTYEFCCPPCIDEFVRRAKEQPQAIREPQDYVKK